MRQHVRFHVRRLELKSVHVDPFEVVYSLDVSDLRGHYYRLFSFFRPSYFNRQERERESKRERERERESKRDVSCDVSDDDETMKPRGRKNCWKSSSDKNLITEQIAVVVRISTKEITHTRTG